MTLGGFVELRLHLVHRDTFLDKHRPASEDRSKQILTATDAASMRQLNPGHTAQWLLALLALARPASAAPATVDVTLQAAFPAPPFLVELLEAAADENSTAYFPLLDRIAEGYFSAAETDKQVYDSFLKVVQEDGHINDPQSISSLEFALSLHATAPRIAAHYQFYNTTARHTGPQDANCEAWLLKDGGVYCSPDQSAPAHAIAESKASLLVLPFDRTSPGHSAQVPILYADINSVGFRNFHNALRAGHGRNQVPYILRHKLPSSSEPGVLAVSGFGVELALKRTDYIVIDDRQASTEESPGAQGNHAVLDDNDQVMDLKPLSSAELRQLGLRAASFVMASDDKLSALLKLTQDFPKYSTAIAGENINAELKAELQDNAATLLPPGMNVLWINGLQTLDRDTDAFSLLEHIRREQKLISSGNALGFSTNQVIQLLTDPAINDRNEQQEMQRYDWRDSTEGNNVITWMNDIEKDRRYSDWSESLRGLLKRTFPGQMPSVRRNIHHVVLPIDFSKGEDITLVVDGVQSFVKRGIPVRFGLVPITQTASAEQQARLVYHLCETYGLAVALNYLEASIPEPGEVASKPDQARFDAAIYQKKTRKDRTVLAYHQVLEDDRIHHKVQNARAYLNRLGAAEATAPYFVNGIPTARNEEWLQVMSNRVGLDLRTLQEAVYTNVIDDSADLVGFYLQKASLRRNALIIPEDEKDLQLFDLTELDDSSSGKLGTLHGVAADKAAFAAGFAQILVIADFETDHGRELFHNAIQFRKLHDNVQLFFLPSTTGGASGFTRKLMAIMTGAGPLELERLEALDAEDGGADGDDDASPFLESVQATLKVLGLNAGSSAVVVNGRLVGPISTNTRLTMEDFEMLLAYENQKRWQPAIKALKSINLEEVIESPSQFARLIRFIHTAQQPNVPEGIFEAASTYRTSIASDLKGEYSSFEIGDIEKASIRMVLAVDPASEMAQRLLPIVKVLTDLAGTHAKIYLNPKDSLTELPVKRFYRNVLYSQPTFDADGKLMARGAHFGGLPADALLTIGMDLPPAWLVSPKDSIHDLDNLRLSSLNGDSVTATYQLDHILIEGHSKDTTTTSAPRGAQLALRTGNGDQVADTLIMANLGYFQFKANPGYYDLSLKPGRSQDIFSINSTGSCRNCPPTENDPTGISLTSFRGTTLFPRLSRHRGMEKEDVLEPGKSALEKTFDSFAGTAGGILNAVGLDGDSAGGWLARAGQKVVSLSNAAAASKAIAIRPHADVNIFSVASGHLYERMLNIMMVSVMKHTSHTVKFWFIEQFLSPSFKSFLPILAEEYGFKYEMVTFKWPHWLRAQKEKQREIWGYKILFLDVLFPLDLDKVIFVDADQIVRTDMYELVQYDLQGAPYGFTPMCDSRTEMEGFRFWKQGYWKNFLRGLPYHISALYVVDLARFRQMAAGDRLRQQYHQLSADPGSLSNLDQDLPNHMQHVLPIHSLPQEWLWCETWCSDESLGVAKTIDLCNNPQTKEPKLERARRQVPEWTVYDDEIAAVAKRKAGRQGGVPGLTDVQGEQERLQAEEYKKKLEEQEAKPQAQDRPRDEL